MLDTLLSPLAPHLCCGCGKTGSILCDSCKHDNAEEPYIGCIMCGTNDNIDGICVKCRQFADRGWCVGLRSGVLRKLVDDYKFERMRSASRTLASLLDDKIEQLPSTTIVVPVPTIPSHIRQRGYDHAALLAKAFARQRELAYRSYLYRETATSQRGAARVERVAQAKVAFTATTSLSPNHPYLLIDDIVTTGATLSYAADALRRAGAKEIWVAAIARQPLD